MDTRNIKQYKHNIKAALYIINKYDSHDYELIKSVSRHESRRIIVPNIINVNDNSCVISIDMGQ